MAYAAFEASAPGSVMLMGEHAVLHGKNSLVAAVNKRIHVKLLPRLDKNIYIHSAIFGDYKTSIDNLKIEAPFAFILAAINKFLAQIKTGFELEITPEFSHLLGLGSSAAVTVAVVAVIVKWITDNNSCNLQKLCLDARDIIREVQGCGSGADVAASVLGGVVAYKAEPFSAKKIASSLPITLVYSGSKLATKKVISLVNERYLNNQCLYDELFAHIDTCALNAIDAIKENDLKKLGLLMDVNYDLQEALGVSNEILAELVFALRKFKHISGAKISGSGLGDCVIALGNIPNNSFPQSEFQAKLGVIQIEVTVSPDGVL